MYIEKELQQIDVIKEKIVETHTTSEVLKEVPYMM